MNLSQDNTQASSPSQQNEDVFLQAHDLTTDMSVSEQIIAEVDTGRTALKGEGITVDESQDSPQMDENSTYQGEIDINHPEDQENSNNSEESSYENEQSDSNNNSELPTENRIIEGSYENKSPMQAPVQDSAQSVHDPFLMG